MPNKSQVHFHQVKVGVKAITIKEQECIAVGCVLPACYRTDGSLTNVHGTRKAVCLKVTAVHTVPKAKVKAVPMLRSLPLI